MKKEPMNLSGHRYGMLAVESFHGWTKSRNAIWRCICDCGNTAMVAAGDLRKKRKNGRHGTMSCGCLRKTAPAKANKRHGMFGTRLYNIWGGMIARCGNDNHRSAHNYKHRGISVCEEWRCFEPFMNWALTNGYQDDLTIERTDNNRGYSPGNCKFITMFDQQSNKRSNVALEAEGRVQTKAQWCKELKIDRGTLDSRLKSGWSIQDALFKPVKKRSPEATA